MRRITREADEWIRRAPFMRELNEVLSDMWDRYPNDVSLIESEEVKSRMTPIILSTPGVDEWFETAPARA